MDNHNPAQKQLELNSLIEFSQLITSKLDLKYILNNILLSIMGKMLIAKGMILLKTENENQNVFAIEAAKGFDSKLINTYAEIDFPKMSVFEYDDIEDKSGFINNSGLKYFFKIYFQNKYLGLICFGKKLNNTELAKNEIIFIETMLNISSSAIENTIKFNQLNNLNNNLNVKVRQLSSLSELGKEFNSNFTNRENIIKLLSYSLLGNFGIKDFIIIARDRSGEFNLLKENKKIDISEFDLKKLFPAGVIPEEFKSTLILQNNSSVPFLDFLYKQGFEIVIPTIIKNEIDYIICIGKKLNKTSYSETDIEFLESIVNLSLISIQNTELFREFLEKQKIENELKIAREIQLALLPNIIPEIPGYDIAGENIPALQVGGDYYDIIKLTDTKTALVIADVSGKGTPASLLMANIQSAVHSYLKLYTEIDFDIAKVTEKINELIYENTSSEKFITFFWGILDSARNTFEYINAGHNPPYLLHKNKIIPLSEGGFMIGILDFGINYEVGKINLEKDDVLVFYTDGVTEAMDKSGEEFGDDRLTDIMKNCRECSSKKILEVLNHSLVEFAVDTPQYDDITAIVLKKL
ncbi:MAG TPA: PP2C family protein-serine/threonine phosphatase [Ignavibacteria bacterium]|nr:PP2C family protein-serine/threonine phosphatase [Ignavibacteria bacterium]HMR39287.1 PP2C family protein-serine/threonine phosphatase [Ignavibacteria bacterium]